MPTGPNYEENEKIKNRRGRKIVGMLSDIKELIFFQQQIRKPKTECSGKRAIDTILPGRFTKEDLPKEIINLGLGWDADEISRIYTCVQLCTLSDR